MTTFKISPDDCLVLKAFRDSSSLREAAKLLNVDPAGLTRKVQSISAEHGLIQKVQNKWKLTSRGLELATWVENCIQGQNKVIESKNSVRIATSNWFALNVIYPNIKVIKHSFGEETKLNFQIPEKSFEQSLLEGEADFVICCHPPESPEIAHKKIIPEEWVVIAPISWKKKYFTSRSTNLYKTLKTLPYVHHTQMNMNSFLSEFDDDQKMSSLSCDNLAGVKEIVINGFGWSIVPKILVSNALNEKKLIDLPYNLNLKDRHVNLWWSRNRYNLRILSSRFQAGLKQALYE